MLLDLRRQIYLTANSAAELTPAFAAQVEVLPVSIGQALGEA